eukprot:745922-Hanusia_phi.AAC.1
MDLSPVASVTENHSVKRPHNYPTPVFQVILVGIHKAYISSNTRGTLSTPTLDTFLDGSKGGWSQTAMSWENGRGMLDTTLPP